MKQLAKSDSTSPTIYDDTEAAKRLNQVVKWILSGATEYDIAEAVVQSYPDENHAKLIGQAMTRITQSANFDSDIVRGFCFEATRDLYRRMVEIGDFTGALRALKALSDLAKT